MKTFLICLSLSFSLAAKELKVLSWNVFLLPGLIKNSHQEERIPLIADFIKKEDYDIVALQEVFTQKYYQAIKSRLKDLYPHDTGLPHRIWYKPVNSGLVVFSKYPLSELKFHPFKRQRHADMFSSKGVQEAQVQVSENQTAHVINTHFQARPEHAEIRKGQLKILKEVLKNKSSEDQLVVVAGDFNIDQKTPEYHSLLASVAMAPMRLLGPLFFTTDSDINNFRDDGGRELIDYVFVKGAKKVYGQKILNPAGAYSNLKEGSLSDHQPIQVILEI